MNVFIGKIIEIDDDGTLSVVKVGITNKITLQVLLVESGQDATFLQKEKKVKLLFKETEVIIATGKDLNVSISNYLEGEIVACEKGKLLSSVQVATQAGQITAVIPTMEISRLELSKNKKVTIFLKMNEIMLSL